MRIFMTGATGFIGGRVARALLDRGDELTILVRDPAKAQELLAAGATVVEGDLTDEAAIAEGMRDKDAVIHEAAIYKVGIPASEREAMHDANVRGTERVLDAAIDAEVPRILYVSSVVVFGHTGGERAGEEFRRAGRSCTSYYEETKLLAHELVDERVARGAPIVTVQPGAVYGPGDHSQLGTMIEQAATGKLKLRMLPDAGFTMAYVDDVAAGVLLALDDGAIGESYILGGESLTMGELVDRVAGVVGRGAPRVTMPTILIKASAPFGRVVGPLMGFPPNLGELIRSSDGVTFYGDDTKARRELGYSPRSLDEGLRETIAAL